MRVLTPVCAVFVGLMCVAAALGQSEAEKGLEVFAGYTRSRSDLACCVGNGNGYHLGAGYAPSRFFAFAAEYSYASGTDPQFVRHFHAGPQFRLPIGSFRPFGRVMLGFSDHQTKCPDLPDVVVRRDFSVALGGGADLVVHPRIAIRAISFDEINAADQWDTRVSFGVVFVFF